MKITHGNNRIKKKRRMNHGLKVVRLRLECLFSTISISMSSHEEEPGRAVRTAFFI